MQRELRFGVITIQNVPWSTLVERWRYLDELGFDSAWVADHFTNYRERAEPWLECWTLLSALANNTRRIRVGTMVTNITFHNPAVLARQALTVDHVSGGRLELGIGAGGAPSDHYMTGVPYWDPPERVARLREFTEIVDRMLRDEVTTYRGRYYGVENANMLPAPVQQPRPPLTLAGWGPKSLRIAAEHADSWNFVPVKPELTPEQNLEETARRNRMLDDYCLELGRDPAGITRSLLVFPRASDNPFDSDEAFHDFVGKYREIGIDEFIIYWWREDALEYGYDRSVVERCADREMLEHLATETIPEIWARS
jgi:alkanesulfonate monooxygenase SsuD/methylene tetrahydromethanopterin reductase-like flavin-dependent oxidoreductase (luciferase family)